MALSAPVNVQTPVTIEGCDQHGAIQRTVFNDVLQDPPLPGSDAGLKNGAIAGIRIADKAAPDVRFGGFVQQALWIGIDGTSAQCEWIETGVTRGAELANGPADVHRYFTGWGERTGDDFQVAVWLLPGSPTIGQLQFFKTVTCETTGSGLYELGCREGAPTPGTWKTCVNSGQFGDNLSNCTEWTAAKAALLTGETQDALGYGSADLHVGLESTCGLSRQNTAMAAQIRYRTPMIAWSPIDTIDWRRTRLLKFPASPSLGAACCNGVLAGAGSTGAECVAPKDFITFLNSLTSTLPAQNCN